MFGGKTVNSEKIYKILRVILPLFGIVVGGVKILGVKGEVALFHSFGVSDQFRIIFGAIQSGGALMMFFPALAMPGIIICIVTLMTASIMMIYNSIFNVLVIPVAGVFILSFYARLQAKHGWKDAAIFFSDFYEIWSGNDNEKIGHDTISLSKNQNSSFIFFRSLILLL